MRKRSKEEERQIVEELLESGVTVVSVAGKYGVRPGQSFEWRRTYKAGRLAAEGNAGAVAFASAMSRVPRVWPHGWRHLHRALQPCIEITGFADSMAGKTSLCRTLLHCKSRQGDWDRNVFGDGTEWAILWTWRAHRLRC